VEVSIHADAIPPVAVHVDAFDEATEENTVAVIAKASEIVNQLKNTSSIIDLICQLEGVTKYKQGVIESQLRHEFEVALKQNVPVGMVTPLAEMFARGTVVDIHVVMTIRGGSIVIYFLCKTVSALYDLRQMITSGFMHDIFTAIVECEARTHRTVDVYVRADEFNFILSCLSSPQDKGVLFDRQLLILKLNKKYVLWNTVSAP